MKKSIISLIFIILCLIALFYQYNKKYPKLLKEISKSDAIGIVKDIKSINLKNIKNPINASIEDFENGFIMTYRVDEKDNTHKKYLHEQLNSFIYVSILDKDLNEIEKGKKIDVFSQKAQDARIFKHLNNYFLVYNDMLNIKHICRAMHIAKLNTNNFKIDYKTNLDQHIQQIEKNWSPFSYNEKIHFSYGLMPHKILENIDPKKNFFNHLLFENNPCLSRFFWKWGTPRGGTPAKEIDGEYLAFFHSCFGKSKKNKFYVMGAYTFENKPPFKIKKVSKFPIIFGDIKKTRIYFPSGFVVKQENGKKLIYLSYGENDNNSKVVILDKDKLFENMKEVY